MDDLAGFDCPWEDVQGFRHEWRVRVFAVDGQVGVEPSDGMTYLAIGLLGNPFPHWSPGQGRYSANPRKIERWKASCQRWCDKENAKAAHAKARLKALGYPTEDNCPPCGKEHGA